jgi:hypothetical protein
MSRSSSEPRSGSVAGSRRAIGCSGVNDQDGTITMAGHRRCHAAQQRTRSTTDGYVVIGGLD